MAYVAIGGSWDQLDHACDTVREVIGERRWWHGSGMSIDDWRLLFREAGAPGGTLQELDPLPHNPRFMHPKDIGQ